MKCALEMIFVQLGKRFVGDSKKPRESQRAHYYEAQIEKISRAA